MSQTSKQIRLAKRPTGMPEQDTFLFDENKVKEPAEGEVVIRTLYLSVDPYMRGRMIDAPSYVPPFELNQVITGSVIGEVVQSNATNLTEGDIVIGSYGWQTYYTANETEVRKIDQTIAPISSYLSILGMTGLTAYFGLLDLGEPTEGETVVITGAAGAVGSVVGQIAKIKGCHVVGIAGSDQKINYLTEELGFDEGINYRTTDDMTAAIGRACPNGVDVFFDNVGGDIADAIMQHLNKYARIPLCGAISSYNLEGVDQGPRIQTQIIKKSARMQGFTLGDFANRFDEGTKALAEWLREGKLTDRVTVVEGFEQTPEAFLDLFRGKNIGKLIVKVAEPEVSK
ncbi:NADP-dependent oxidoreductase [Paraliobacillus ryukyuensis]|uniref:NADP-dependent oxidoreductase n=1 Tax=Paraliobacillus ryukyuensis TaxID=200904 RepID=UPI0009A5AEEE|nr:NADP-dependent oxidoreductase [Paraliobacillus ryukyuensis]